MISIKTGAPIVDGAATTREEALLRVNSSFRLNVGDLSIIDEPSFPTLELIEALKDWSADGNFEYNSFEADVSPLLFIKCNHGYYVASPLSRTCSDTIVERKDILDAFEQLRENFEYELHALNKTVSESAK